MKDIKLFTGIRENDDLIVRVFDTAIAFPMPSGFWQMFLEKLILTKKDDYYHKFRKAERLFVGDLIDLCRKKIIEENERGG